MNNVINQMPFLRTTREFPEEIHQLAQEVSKSYLDTAAAVNARTIGLFVINRPTITGNSYYLIGNGRNQSFRQVFTFGTIATGATLLIPYKFQGFSQFVAIYGTCLTDLPDARPLPYPASTLTNVIAVRVDTVNFNIVIAVGGTSPNITSGMIVLEWIASV